VSPAPPVIRPGWSVAAAGAGRAGGAGALLDLGDGVAEGGEVGHGTGTGGAGCVGASPRDWWGPRRREGHRQVDDLGAGLGRLLDPTLQGRGAAVDPASAGYQVQAIPKQAPTGGVMKVAVASPIALIGMTLRSVGSPGARSSSANGPYRQACTGLTGPRKCR